jgi:hypothetical protein
MFFRAFLLSSCARVPAHFGLLWCCLPFLVRWVRILRVLRVLRFVFGLLCFFSLAVALCCLMLLALCVTCFWKKADFNKKSKHVNARQRGTFASPIFGHVLGIHAVRYMHLRAVQLICNIRLQLPRRQRHPRA